MRAPLALAMTLLFVATAMAQETETKVASKEEGASAELMWAGLEGPVDLAFGPDGALYFAEFTTGAIRVIPPGASAPLEEPVWTAPDLQLGGERGFVGLALHPDFATTRAFYVFYNHNSTGETVNRLSRVVDGEEDVLLEAWSGLLHNSGRIAFHPDGTLLVSMGDGIIDTSARSKSVHAHDPTDLHGKVLRLTEDGKAAPGNPWDNEVWTKGHRNVYGLAVSPEGVVFATENGPDHWDEVNVLEAGNDYGWPSCTGMCDDPEFVDPILTYDDTIAPTGAAWYEGAWYFADFNKGRLHRVHVAPENGTIVDERVVKFTTPRLLDVTVGPDGLYVSTWDAIWRIVPGPDPHGTAPPTPVGTPTLATPPPTSPVSTPAGPDGEGAIGEGTKGIPLPVFAPVVAAGLAARVRQRWMRRG